MKTSHEQPTDELRQVLQQVGYIPAIHSGTFGRTACTTAAVVSIQRKWLIRDGQPYIADISRSPDDQQGEWYARGGDEIGWQWIPMRAEWRDLPVVNDLKAP